GIPAGAVQEVEAPGAPHQLGRRVPAPAGTTHIGWGLAGRTSPAPRPPSVAGHYAGIMTSAPPASDHHLRHRRRHGVDTGLLWGDNGTCWVWLTRPGHRRLRLHRC